MRFTIDVDTGGTFTDGFFTTDGEMKTVKVPTTPHDLTVCLDNCIRQGAREFNVSLQEMLINAEVVRYSTTIATNTIVQKTGSKIGLIISKGYEDALYRINSKVEETVYSIVNRELITTITESTDNQGKKSQLDKDEIIKKMQLLIDMGARSIVVSFKNSHINPAHEREVRDTIKNEYPVSFLGSVRVFLASDISDQPSDYHRTTSALLNAYVHDALAKYLYKAEDNLRTNFYRHPLLICLSNGGVSTIAKTKAVDTSCSGPVSGLCAAAQLGELYGHKNVLSADVGGTTLDMGIIRDGQYVYEMTPEISGITINVPMASVGSIGVAGGSIVSLNSENDIQIGPRSVGGVPGPACFGLGGMEATVTDADVVLGYLDPDDFLGGRMKLNDAKAKAVIERKIAKKRNISVSEAAWLIKEKVEQLMQAEVLTYAAGHGIGLNELSNFQLVVYGGGGATRCCGFSKGLKFAQIVISPFSSVLSAFGSSMADLVHSYSKYVNIQLFDGKTYMDNFAPYNDAVAKMLETAKRDIKGEGYSPKEANYFIELIIENEDSSLIRVKSDQLQLSSKNALQVLCDTIRNSYSLVKNGKDASVPLIVQSIELKAVIMAPNYEFKISEPADRSPEKALVKKRDVMWSPNEGYRQTPVYDLDLLVPGNMVNGPAIIKAKDTTYVLPDAWSLSIDKYSNAIIEEQSA